MNCSELDMNIDNYELQDLLDLFHLDYNFNEEDLKKTKKTVLMTHPDKSNLSKEYFLFFSAAYMNLDINLSTKHKLQILKRINTQLKRMKSERCY
jgi:hypothetical protein